MLNFLATVTIATYMALSQPVMNDPDTSNLETNVNKIELAMNSLRNIPAETVEGGIRHKFLFPEYTIINGEEFKKVALSYVILVDEEGHAKERLTATLISDYGETIISAFDGYVNKKYDGPIDGKLEATAFLVDASYFKRLKLARRSGSTDIDYVFEDDLGTTKITEATPYFKATIEAYNKLKNKNLDLIDKTEF